MELGFKFEVWARIAIEASFNAWFDVEVCLGIWNGVGVEVEVGVELEFVVEIVLLISHVEFGVEVGVVNWVRIGIGFKLELELLSGLKLDVKLEIELKIWLKTND